MGEGGFGRFDVLGSALRRPALRRVALVFGCFKTAEIGVWVGVVTVVYGIGGVGAATLVMVLQLGPAAMAALAVDRAAQRVGERAVLAGGLASQAAGMIGIAASLHFDAPTAVLFACAVLTATAVVTTRPTLSALLPRVVEVPNELTAANSLIGWLDGASLLLGPAITAAGFAAVGTSAPFAVFAVLVGVATVAALRLDIDLPNDRSEEAGAFPGTTDGDGTGRRADPGPVRMTLLVLGAYGFLLGALDVFQVVVAIDLTGGTEARAAVLATAFGLGALLGGLGTTILIGHRRLTPSLGIAAVVSGVSIALVGTTTNPVAAGFLLCICGAGSAVLLMTARTTLQRVADFATLCRAFSLAESADMAMLLAGALAIPLFASVLTPQWTGAGIGALVVVASLAALRTLARAEDGAVAQLDRLAVLRRNPLLAPLPAPALETLARQSVRETIETGHTVITEGELGDRYYVIESGRVAARRGDELLRELGPDAGFGEIALLLNSPRTASVVSTEPTTLISIDRQAFLLVVTGHAPSRQRAHSFAERLVNDVYDDLDT